MRVNPEKKEEKERIAAALLHATLQLAAAHGFASLGLREVSRAVEIAPTSFYRHFADMEELGLTLVRDRVSPFLAGWVEGARAASASGQAAAEAVAERALESVESEPALMRFILAERIGAAQTFRAALAEQLSVVSAAVERAISADKTLRASLGSEPIADAVVALVLEACGQMLDQGKEARQARTTRLLGQIRLLFAGALRTEPTR